MDHRTLVRSLALPALAAAALVVAAPASANHEHTTSTFMGAKVNAGTVTHSTQGGKEILTLSDDFKVPDAPDPHRRIIDSHGTAYLLQRVVVKPEKINRAIVVPEHVKDVAKVQMWCAYAETLLDEASFSTPVAMRHDAASSKAIAAEGRPVEK